MRLLTLRAERELRLNGSRCVMTMLPAEGLVWFEERATPTAILLTNRHHYRASGALVDAFGCAVHCHRAGTRKAPGTGLSCY